MTKILYFDTETTGLRDFNKPLDHPDQPKLVQFSGIFENFEEKKNLNTIDLIIKPTEWVIPDDVVKFHGITHKKGLEYGTHYESALCLFHELYNKADYVVAHNIEYDWFVMNHMYTYFGTVDEPLWNSSKHRCTMKLTTQVVKLPPTSGKRENKWPKLQELHKFLFGHEFEGAHNSFNDVQAMQRCYHELVNRKVLTHANS